MSQPEAQGLRGEPKKGAIGVKRVLPPGIDKLEDRFFPTIYQPLTNLAVDAKDEVQGVSAEPGDRDYLCDASDVQTLDACARSNVVKARHLRPLRASGVDLGQID